MKKNRIIAIFVSIAVTLVASFSATVAWFESAIRFDVDDANITGSSEGAYYDYGKGTSLEPYGIKSPRHLYNLAWLQYLGQYNKIENNTRKQFYFELAADIDMTGYTLPPIGTQTYPFIGRFNGNGYTISNLNVSNNFGDYDKKPDIVSSVSGVEIVGLFGVVGSLNTPVTDENAASVSMTDSLGTASYDSQINELINFGIDNLTVSTQTNSTLIGLAAGYVNGTIEGVGVANSNINIAKQNANPLTYTSNLSDYSLVGYTTPKFKSGIQRITKSADTPDVQFSGADSSGDKWGGSISMKTMYDRLNSVRSNVATSYTYTGEKNFYKNATEPFSSSDSNLDWFTDPYNYEYTGGNEIDSHGDAISSFNFADRDGTPQFIYLDGERTFQTTLNYYDDFSTLATGELFYLKSGDNYMTLGNAVGSTTAIGSATLLSIDNNRRIKSNEGNNYLRNNNGALQRTNGTTNATQWTLSNGAISSTASNGISYALTYNNGWGLQALTEESDYYLLSYNSNYVRVNNGTIANTTSTANAAHFYFDNNNRCYCLDGNTQLFIGIQATVNQGSRRTYYTNPALTISNSPTLYLTYSNNRLQCTYAQNNNNNNYNTTRYLRYSNGWQLSTTSQNLTRAHEQIEVDSASNYPLTYVKKNDALTQYEDAITTKPTYFPLSYDQTVTTDVFDYNTGYVVAGSNYNNSGSMPGDIRVSHYAKSSISASQINNSSSTLDIVTRTASSGDFTLISDSYNGNTATNPNNAFSNAGINTTRINYSSNQLKLEKYEKSRTYFDQILNTDNPNNYIYGLHFMDALIDINKTVRAPKAVINEMIYDLTNTNGGYQLPQDCIDFNLKAKGYINFFAGTYFSGNTTFFSLHEISRDNSYDITDIKEISAIYNNDSDSISARQNKPFIYEYVGGGTNLETGDVKGTLAFDMEWVKSPKMVNNAVYYFEVPVNKGEYALGSVSGKNGAYLMYLDIGASANSTDVTIVRETIRTVTENYSFPLGIDFVDEAEISAIVFANITGGTTTAVYLVKPTSGNIQGKVNYIYTKGTGAQMFNRLDCSPPQGSSFTGHLGAVFIANNAECYFNSSKVTAEYTSREVRVTKRKTEYYYDINTHEVSYEVYERTEDGEGGLIQDYISVESESLGEDADFYTSEVQLRVADDDAITLIKFSYDKLPGNTVTIKTFYNPETFTYNFTIECTQDILIYVEELVEQTVINEITINFTYQFNESTIAEGNFYTITGSGS